MKLIIDIDEEMYNRIALTPRCASLLDAYNDRDMFVKAIQRGTPLDKIIAGLEAHKWNKDEGSKAIYNSAISDAITYVEECMNRDAEAQATDFLAEARACAER